MNRPTRRIMTGLLVLLTCPALSTHPLASDSAVEKLLLLSADTEAVFSPGVVDGRNDVLTLDARFAVRLTDALRSLESGPSGSSDTQFFVEWEWTILALDGVTPFT